MSAALDTVQPFETPEGVDLSLIPAGPIPRVLAWGIDLFSPAALKDSIRLYATLMFGESPLSRAQREMIAVVTSQANECHY